jgi:outer membrane lipoprotein-sorting protein
LEQISRKLEARSLRIDLEWIQTPPAGMGGSQRTRGILRLAPGNKFSFRTQSLVLVSDGATLWQYIPAAKQVLVQKLSVIDPSQLPTGLLQNALKAKELSSKAETRNGTPCQRFDLKAESLPLSRYASVQLWIRQDQQLPTELLVQDDQGGSSNWKLHRFQDFEPDSKTFTFLAPAGTSVVDTRK